MCCFPRWVNITNFHRFSTCFSLNHFCSSKEQAALGAWQAPTPRISVGRSELEESTLWQLYFWSPLGCSCDETLRWYQMTGVTLKRSWFLIWLHIIPFFQILPTLEFFPPEPKPVRKTSREIHPCTKGWSALAWRFKGTWSDPTNRILQANRVKIGYDSKMVKGAFKTKRDTSRIETRAISCSPKLGQNFESIRMFIIFLLSFKGFLLFFSVPWKKPWRHQPLNHWVISYYHHFLMKYDQPRISYSCKYSVRPFTNG